MAIIAKKGALLVFCDMHGAPSLSSPPEDRNIRIQREEVRCIEMTINMMMSTNISIGSKLGIGRYSTCPVAVTDSSWFCSLHSQAL